MMLPLSSVYRSLWMGVEIPPCHTGEIQVSALLFPCLIGLMVGASLLGCSEMSMLLVLLLAEQS